MPVNPASPWWKVHLWKIVLFPTLAAVLLALVSVLRGYLHQRAGFDSDGRPIHERPARVARALKTTHDTLTAIAADLEQAEPARRPLLRYLDLSHRHNEPRCSEGELAAWRQALQELAGHLSPPTRTVTFPALDRDQTIFRLDVAELGWSSEIEWRQVLNQYPYGLSHDGAADERLRGLAGKVKELSGDRLAWVRADWFLVALTRPPLSGPRGSLGLPAQPLPGTIRRLAHDYLSQVLDARAVQAELALPDERALFEVLKKHARLRDEFRLAPLLRDGTIRREWWESTTFLFSPYQELSRQLGLGRPLRLQ